MQRMQLPHLHSSSSVSSVYSYLDIFKLFGQSGASQFAGASNLEAGSCWRSLKLDDLRFVLNPFCKGNRFADSIRICIYIYLVGLTLILRYFEPFQPSASILENRKEKEANHLMVKQKKQKKARESSTCHLLHTSVWDIPIQFNTINRFSQRCVSLQDWPRLWIARW